MIEEISDGEPLRRRRQVPKYVKLAMFEGKYGFLLEPVCLISLDKVEVNRVRIPKKGRSMLGKLYGGQETWQVQVWESAEGFASENPTWMITFGPDTSYEQASEKAEKVKQSYQRADEIDEFSQFFRPAEPRICLPPKKPEIIFGKENSPETLQRVREYEIQCEERAARFKVLSTILPKTVELAERAEAETATETKRQLELESLEAYFAENAPGWSPLIFKAWQRLNPIALKWMQWLYVWNSRQVKRRNEINAIDYELAFNWTWNGYFLLTAEELRDAVFKATNQSLGVEAIKKRRERLGLTTLRQPGPRPNVSQ